MDHDSQVKKAVLKLQQKERGHGTALVSGEYGSIRNTTYEVIVNPASISIELFAGVTDAILFLIFQAFDGFWR